ncbi:MAG: uroporphyrinogen-III C-methyltransferase [Chitinophagaceae bacterium]
MTKPTLFLVGAGPGDAELITLKAVKVIQSADVVLYDALVNPELLDYCRPDCVQRFVGKRMGCHALSQEEINALIIDESHRHNHIVRLKGGDPSVFGRAYEEMLTAQSAGMHVEVIPGISSAIAVPQAAMIPITCRGVSESFWVTTGTTRSGDISSDIRLAAQSTATVIILMAMSKLEKIMEIFAHYGKAKTPVAIIQEGCTPNQKTVIGTVNDIFFRAQEAAVANPAIVVVGEVVNNRLDNREMIHAMERMQCLAMDKDGRNAAL